MYRDPTGSFEVKYVSHSSPVGDMQILSSEGICSPIVSISHGMCVVCPVRTPAKCQAIESTNISRQNLLRNFSSQRQREAIQGELGTYS